MNLQSVVISLNHSCPLLGAEVTEDEQIVDSETGEVITSNNGEELTIDEIGYLGSGEDGSIEPVRNDFPSIVNYLSDRE